MSRTTFPLALDAPLDDVTPITRTMLRETAEAAKASPRLRIIQPLHKSPDATLHRMLNALQPGTYIRPHRHLDPPKAESFVVLQGRVGFVTFDDAGAITGSYTLGADDEALGIDLEPGVYHSFVVLAPDTVIFETKPGPYAKATDKAFASWAPEEYTPEAEEYVKELEKRF